MEALIAMLKSMIIPIQNHKMYIADTNIFPVVPLSRAQQNLSQGNIGFSN